MQELIDSLASANEELEKAKSENLRLAQENIELRMTNRDICYDYHRLMVDHSQLLETLPPKPIQVEIISAQDVAEAERLLNLPL